MKPIKAKTKVTNKLKPETKVKKVSQQIQPLPKKEVKVHTNKSSYFCICTNCNKIPFFRIHVYKGELHILSYCSCPNRNIQLQVHTLDILKCSKKKVKK